MKVWVKSLIGSLLALLGFRSCDPATIIEQPDMYGPGPDIFGPVEYGCPTAAFKFLGEAVNEKGEPVPGIRIRVLPRGENDSWDIDTLYTGADGKAEKILKYDFPDTKDMKAVFEDVDGSENGSYHDRELFGAELAIEKTAEGDGHWNEGEFTITAKAVMVDKGEE